MTSEIQSNEGRDFEDNSPVAVHVIHTDEEWMIAKTICRVLGIN